MVLFGAASSVGVPVFELDQPVCVRRVAPNSAAALGGLRPGDQPLTVGGTAMPRVSKSPSLLDEAVARRDEGRRRPQRAGGGDVMRDGKELRLACAAAAADAAAPPPPLGVELAAQCGAVRREKLAVPAAAARATYDTSRGLRAVGAGLAQILGGLLSGGARPDVQGPLGIAQSGASIAARDPSQLLAFGAMLSLNLALLNSLPLPGLDGFQILVLSGEKATGRKLSDDAQGAISGATALLFSSSPAPRSPPTRGTPACRWRGSRRGSARSCRRSSSASPSRRAPRTSGRGERTPPSRRGDSTAATRICTSRAARRRASAAIFNTAHTQITSCSRGGGIPPVYPPSLPQLPP